MVHKFFDKMCSGGAVTRADKPTIKSEIMPHQQLLQELLKPIIRNFVKRKVYSSFNNNNCSADLADTQFVSIIKEFFFSYV